MVNKKERTVVVIKPDGVQRGLIGEIIQRFERAGLKLVGLKMFVPNSEFIESHYLLDPEWKQKTGQRTIDAYEKKGLKHPIGEPIKAADKILDGLKKYLAAGPVVAMVWQGVHAVEIVRKITGGTEPLSSDVGTIRGDYVLDSYQIADDDNRAVRNLIHASGSAKEADQEVGLWFKQEELTEYRLVQEQILYDVNLDGLLE